LRDYFGVDVVDANAIVKAAQSRQAITAQEVATLDDEA